MFKLEPEDVRVLENIEEEIAKGAQIFFAVDETNNSVMSCAMIAPIGEDVWEFEKFATRPEYSGRGLGSLCLNECIEYARCNGAKRILIVTNTKCASAVHLYRKNGFKEVPINKEVFPFERGNISFELSLDEN
ncbi:MAG: GNAT family N-acetyltransferase [Planctomycetia bacterium]|nr:GNAT family N-acetyltransferase [Planctomycetia bacterium]